MGTLKSEYKKECGQWKINKDYFILTHCLITRKVSTYTKQVYSFENNQIITGSRITRLTHEMTINKRFNMIWYG